MGKKIKLIHFFSKRVSDIVQAILNVLNVYYLSDWDLLASPGNAVQVF